MDKGVELQSVSVMNVGVGADASAVGGDDHAPRDPLDEARDLVLHPDLPHSEKHFLGAEIVRDVVIGMADGLTVPFALAAGLSALDSSSVVVTAGLAGTTAPALLFERKRRMQRPETRALTARHRRPPPARPADTVRDVVVEIVAGGISMGLGGYAGTRTGQRVHTCTGGRAGWRAR